MKSVNALKFIGIIAVVALLIVLIYNLFLKKEVVELSSRRLSELMNMDVSFESYKLFDETTLEITGLTITSRYPKSKYKEVNDYHTDWINAKINRLRLIDFNYNQLIENKQFFATAIDVDTVQIQVYRDKNLPDPPFKYKPLVIELLKSAKADIKADTVRLRQMDIVYVERTKHSEEEPGKISFKDLYATGYNLTNDSAQLAQNPRFTIDARCLVMGEAKIKAHIVFHVKDEYFTFSANVSPFDAPMLNPVITGTLPAKITDGHVKDLELEFQADNEKAAGTVDIQYEGLQFDIYSEEGSELKSFITTQAAKIALRSTNLKRENNYEKGEISFERYKNKFIFNYWWNSLKTGLIDAILSDTADELIDIQAREKKEDK